MVMDLSIIIAPNSPGSRQLTSPPAADLAIAPAKVWHGSVRLQGFASLPAPETHIRVCVWADVAPRQNVRIPTQRQKGELRCPMATLSPRHGKEFASDLPDVHWMISSHETRTARHPPQGFG